MTQTKNKGGRPRGLFRTIAVKTYLHDCEWVKQVAEKEGRSVQLIFSEAIAAFRKTRESQSQFSPPVIYSDNSQHESP